MQARNVRILSIAFFTLLLLWGGYTFLYYLGTEYHSYNLVNDQAFEMLAKTCDGTTANFCRGVAGLFPFLVRSIARLSPFLWYGILSAVAFGGLFLWRSMMAGEKTLRLRWTPWKLLLVTLGLLWLMFTVITWGPGRDEKSTRFLVEPSTQTHTAGEQAIAQLKADHDDFLARGCLEQIGETVSGAKAYLFKRSCIQTSFFTRVLPQVLFVLGLLFELLVLGRGILSLFRLRRPLGLPVEALLSAVLGACGMIAVLWLLAVAHVYVFAAGWLIAVLIPALLFMHARYWIGIFLRHEWATEHDAIDPIPLLVWLLGSYVLFGFLSVVRPFPIGWDDLGSYLNRPHLLVSYGKFIFSMAGFDWAYLTSLGYLLFGYDSVFGTTASMMVNWMAGLLAFLSVWVFGRHFLGARRGVVAALLYCILPLVGHFSFADMKIDNAVFLFGVVAMLMTFMALIEKEDDAQEGAPRFSDTHRLLLIAGILIGFAIGTKVTAAMMFLTLLAVVLGLVLHWSGFIGGIGIAFIVLSVMDIFSAQNILERIVGGPVGASANTISLAVFGVIAAGGIGYAIFRSRSKEIFALTAVLAFLGGIAIGVVPWVEHNNILRGQIVPRIELGAPNSLSPSHVFKAGEALPRDNGQDIRVLPDDLRVDKTLPACLATGGTEELDRYWGHDGGISHYLTLPWRTVMNLDSNGYYVTTMAALLLFPLLLLLPYFWTPAGRWLRWLAAATALLTLQWILLANGIPWYGIGMFLGLTIALEAMIVRAPDHLSRAIGSGIVGLSILACFGFRMGQFEQQRSMYEYPMGKISAKALQEVTIAHYDDIVATLDQRRRETPDRPYLYRIGTFIPYFVPRSLEVIGMQDHQLDAFNCLYAERDPELTVRRLKALGFNSFVLDLNTQTIESDPNGSLHKKVRLFQEFVNDPRSGLQVVLNDENAGIAYILIP